MKKAFLGAVLIGGILGSAATVQAEPEETSCSNRTLQGYYGFSVEGTVFPAPGLPLPLNGVALTHFDGRGSLNQIDHVIVNGAAPALEWTPGVGTYTVNADCTGSLRIDAPSNNSFVNLRFVVVKQGREIRTVVTTPFSGPPRNVSSIGIKVE